MNKEQFLNELKLKLNKLPKQDQEEIIQDYKEYFYNAQIDGKEEVEVVTSLGSPTKLAKELVATYYIDEVEKKATVKNILHAVWATVGLGFLNLIFILGPFIGVAAIVLGLWLSAIAFVLSPLLMLINPLVTTAAFSLFNFFNAIILAGLGILLGVGMYYCTKKLIKWTVRYLKYNVEIVKGGKING